MKQTVESNWHKYRGKRVTPGQIKALQAGYSALKKAEDAKGLDEREQRLKWATLKLGFPIKSFSDLNSNEACYLIDYLNGERTKLDEKIDAEMERLKVLDKAAYFDVFCKGPRSKRMWGFGGSKTMWGFGGRGFNDLNRFDKMKLIEVLVNRAPKIVQ